MERQNSAEEMRRILASRIPTTTDPEHHQQHHFGRNPFTNPPSDLFLDPHQSLEASFNNLNLSSTHSPLHLPFPSPSSSSLNGVINGNVIENPTMGSSIMGQSYNTLSNQTIRELQREIQLRDTLLEQMTEFIRAQQSIIMDSQGLEDFNFPLLNASPVINDPSFNLSNGGVNGEFGNTVHPYSDNEFSSQYPMRPCLNRNGLLLDPETLELGYLNSPRSSNYQSYLNSPRSSNYQRYSSLEELRGRMVEVAKDHYGCRFLQKIFEEGNERKIRFIFVELKDHLSELMKDKYSNYLVQKLLEVCNIEQITEVVLSVTRNRNEFVNICRNTHGTRVVQKLLDRLMTPQQISQLMSALGPASATLSKDSNGHHVIERCFQHFSNENNQSLLPALVDHCFDIATDRWGCCVLQKSLGHTRGELTKHLVAEITENALVLSQDPYGNYVVQFVLGMRIPDVTMALMEQLTGNFVSFSMQQFSSNVVEKFLETSSKEQCTQIIKELIDSPNILMLLQDAFGNYVIQTALKVSHTGRIFGDIVDLVEIHYLSLCSNPYGRRVIDLVNQLSRKHV